MVNMKKTLFNSKVSALQLILMVIMTSAYLMSNVLTNFQWYLGSLVITGGTLTFPITYVLSDLFSEIYGYKWSRRSAWLSFAMNLSFVIVLNLMFLLPATEWTDVTVWKAVLGSSTRILIGSFAAYVFGGWLDDLVFYYFQKKDGEKRFGFRAILSSFAGECVDSLLFYPIAFFGTVSLAAMVNMMIVGVLVKTGYEIIILPVTKKLVKVMENLGEREYYEA